MWTLLFNAAFEYFSRKPMHFLVIGFLLAFIAIAGTYELVIFCEFIVITLWHFLKYALFLIGMTVTTVTGIL